MTYPNIYPDPEYKPLPQYVPLSLRYRRLIRNTVAAAMIFGALGFWAGRASAQDRMTLAPATGHCFAVVVIENRAGSYNADESLDTIHGPVVLRYRTVGGHNAVDADEVTVILLPDDVAAVPMAMALPDGETGMVCLIEWIGG